MRCLRTLCWMVLSFGVFFSQMAGAQGYRLDISRVDSVRSPNPFLARAVGENVPDAFDALVRAGQSVAWEPVIEQTFNAGYQSEPVWLYLPLVNQSENPLRRLMEIAYPLLDEIDIYFVSEGQLKEHLAIGDKRPFESRPIPHRNFLIPLELEAGQAIDVYIRVSSSSALQVPISLAPEAPYFLHDQQELVGHAFYFGLLSVLVLINLCLFLYLRQAVYLYYVCFVSCIAGFQFVFHGFPAQYLPGLPLGVSDRVLLLLIPSVMLAVILFTRQFLRLDRLTPRINRGMLILAGYSLLCMALSVLLPYEWSVKVSLTGILPLSLLCLVAGGYLWHRGFKAARLYSIAWSVLIVSGVLIAMNKWGVLPRTFVTENGLQLGSALEAVLLSLALADRLNREREERYRAQEVALEETRQRQLVEDRLMQTALHNPLTSLPNRPFFENWFELQQQELSPPRQVLLGLVYLSRLHEVHKTLGPRQADELLRMLTRRLSRRAQGIRGLVVLRDRHGEAFPMAQLDNMTFAILINTEINPHATASVRNLANMMAEPIEFMGMLIDVGGVAGVSSYPAQGIDAPTMIQNAQIAIDMSLKSGNLLTPYSDDINPYSARRLTLAGELRKAINRGDLELFFQPKISASANRVTGMEALLRWNHPEHGTIPPDEFIQLAEQTGIIHPLTEWVLDDAVAKLCQLDCLGVELTVSVNISAINLKEKRFVETVGNILAHHGLEPSRLILEVTETAMMEDAERALTTLRELHALGVYLSIDDFGTGYSSLNYIKRLPVHEIKIDRSFVMDMDTTLGDAIIVRTTVNMCHDLGLTVVAEGVETSSTCQTLQKMGCDYLQGYYLSRPLPFDTFVKWVGDGTVRRVAS